MRTASAPVATTPFSPGHTAIARVVATGADAVRIEPGQLVYIDGFIGARDDPDGYGQAVIGLLDGFTPGSKKLFKAWGGLWCDAATVPLEQCYPLNEQTLTSQGYTVNDMQILERLCLAYGAFCAANLKPGQTVIVAPSSGAYSGSVAEVAAQLGCKVIALTRSAPKLEPLTAQHPSITAVEIKATEDETAAAIRAACPPAGADAYIDITPPLPGSAITHFKPCLSAVRAFGHVILMGMLFDVQLDYLSVMTRSITMKGQMMYTRSQAAETIHLVESGILKLGKAAGHEVMGEFKLEDWEKAIEKAESVVGWGQQVLFTPQS